MRRMSQTTTIFLIRHGDRFDYANKELWKRSLPLGLNPHDSPLSSVGHAQARSVATALASAGVERILASPYLRVIQTAQPLAHATGIPISIEDGLSELGHEPGSVVPAQQRFAYFPEIDITYSPLHTVSAPERVSSFPLLYFRRILSMAAQLQRVHDGKTIACFSHAASVALVAALTCSSVSEAGRFAPCGIFKLVKDGTASSWRIEQHGGDNSSHCSQNTTATFPWCFSDSQDPEVRKNFEACWLEAKRLGPL